MRFTRPSNRGNALPVINSPVEQYDANHTSTRAADRDQAVRRDHSSSVTVGSQISRQYTRNSASSSTSSVSTGQLTTFQAKRAKLLELRSAILKSIASHLEKDVTAGESIEFDWAADRLSKLHALDTLARQYINIGDSQMNEDAMHDWISNTLRAYPQRQWEMSVEQIESWFEKLEEMQNMFTPKRLISSHGSYVSAQPDAQVPYPLSYDAVSLQNDQHSYEFLKKIYDGLPSIHPFHLAGKPVKYALDLGCGDGSWIIDTAQCWKDTQFYGIDVQQLQPTQMELAERCGQETAERIKFKLFNILSGKLPFLDGVFDMVRMANLKWCIPRNKWNYILLEARRVLATGGLLEIIDDDFVTHTDTDSPITDEQLGSCHAVESQFAEVLHARNLALETNGLVLEGLKEVFPRSHHQDIMPVAISPKMGGVRSTPSTTMETGKDDGGNGNHRISTIIKRISSVKFPVRSRSGSETSQSSDYSQSSGSGSSATRSTTRSTFDDDDDDDEGSPASRPPPPSRPLPRRPLPLRPQPLGLVVSGRFIPCTADEILIHATKNMQCVLAARETARSYLVPSSKLPTGNNRDQQMRKREFDDMYWMYEITMGERLNVNIPQDGIDLSEAPEANTNSAVQLKKDSKPPRSISTFADIHKKYYWDGDREIIAQELSAEGLDKLIRIIRVYTAWK